MVSGTEFPLISVAPVLLGTAFGVCRCSSLELSYSDSFQGCETLHEDHSRNQSGFAFITYAQASDSDLTSSTTLKSWLLRSPASTRCRETSLQPNNNDRSKNVSP